MLILCLVLPFSVVGVVRADDGVLGKDNAGSMTFTLYAGEYAITQDKEGLDVIQMEGFSSTTSPGDPMLPHKVYNIAVPPDIVWSSLKLNIVSAGTSVLEGTYDIRPAPPILPGTNDTEVEESVEKKETINDRNMEVYGTDAEFPESYLELLPYSQMRKWKYTRVGFTPFQYNPVSQKLTLIQSVTIEITYEQSGIEPQASLMNDTVMDDVAAQIFFNYQQVKSMYKPGAISDAPSVTYDYVIITANAIEANSTKLSSFASHKASKGHSVLVITEDEFGGLAGQAPNHKAEKIRKWLIGNYAAMGIEYVLLVGDPHPYESTEGDIPMKMCHPEMNQTEYDCEPTPTDYFYADLTGNWDHDGDGYYGEWTDDYPVSGGVDFAPEVYVGRIPVYGAAYTTLDSILQKIIDYETEASIGWRKSALLPMGFQQEGYDGAALAQQMRDDYLNAAGFSPWRMYQQGNGACGLNSIYTSEEELRGGTVVRDRWAANDYGIVCWWGHGSETATVVGYEGCWDGTLFQSSYCSSLDDDHPSFTYQCSCTNGYPEHSDNLQYAILKQGGIGTVSATRVSWFSTGVGYDEFDGSPTNSGIGYEYVKRLVSDNPAGQALYSTKQSITPNHQCWLMNWYDFNLCGDPATSLSSQGGEPNIAVSPTSFNVTLPTNTSHNYTLTISNDGDAELTYDITDEETTGTTTPAPAGEVMPSSPPEHTGEGLYDVLVQAPPSSEPASPQGTFSAGYDLLYYDDGTAEEGHTFSPFSTGSRWAVRFTPLSYPARLETAWVHLWDRSVFPDGDHEQFEIEVWDDDGGSGAPGTLLGTTTTTATNWGWWSVDISGMDITIPSGDFYIAYRQMTTYPDCEALSADTTSPDSRSWEAHWWEPWALHDPLVDFMIRCEVSTGCTWLSTSPDSGTVAASGSDDITVSFDTTGLAEGDYSADIVIASNDPDENPKTVPVTLHVSSGNNAPNTPSNPSPANDATGVSINADLSWSGGDPDAEDIVTYNVYFGTNSTPPLKETIGPYAANQTSISYDPGTLSYNITYYWKIVARDNHGITKEGPVWDFTTEAEITITGVTGEVNCDTLSEVTVELYKDETLIDSTTSGGDGNYSLPVPETGDYDVVASKEGFKDETQTIDITELGQGYPLDFCGETGLIPKAPDVFYVLECVNHWLFPVSPCELTVFKVLEVVNAWLFPTV